MAKNKVKRKSRSIVIGHLENINSKVFDSYLIARQKGTGRIL